MLFFIFIQEVVAKQVFLSIESTDNNANEEVADEHRATQNEKHEEEAQILLVVLDGYLINLIYCHSLSHECSPTHGGSHLK
jgi:hypothetical protein